MLGLFLHTSDSRGIFLQPEVLNTNLPELPSTPGIILHPDVQPASASKMIAPAQLLERYDENGEPQKGSHLLITTTRKDVITALFPASKEMDKREIPAEMHESLADYFETTPLYFLLENVRTSIHGIGDEFMKKIATASPDVREYHEYHDFIQIECGGKTAQIVLLEKAGVIYGSFIPVEPGKLYYPTQKVQLLGMIDDEMTTIRGDMEFSNNLVFTTENPEEVEKYFPKESYGFLDDDGPGIAIREQREISKKSRICVLKKISIIPGYITKRQHQARLNDAKGKILNDPSRFF